MSSKLELIQLWRQQVRYWKWYDAKYKTNQYADLIKKVSERIVQETEVPFIKIKGTVGDQLTMF